MPELPEVESLRQGLEKHILNQKILNILVGKPKLVSGRGNIREASMVKVKEFIKELEGETFKSIDRQAKNLIFNLKSGKVIVVHLKMSGQLVYQARDKTEKKIWGGHPIEITEKKLPHKHSHVIFKLSRGTLYYNDTRMFGYLLYYPSLVSASSHFETYGLDPLRSEFTLKKFAQGLQNKKGKLKTVLMGQTVVTGVGNIYADESLFRAQISPLRSASSLKAAEIKKLYVAIKKILRRAIELGGSSVSDYLLADGSRGNYARELKVYGRGGLPCIRCGNTLSLIQMNNRTTVYCKNFQK